MKLTLTFRTLLTLVVAILMMACSSNKIKGTASDKTGTNGATNGTGKIAKSL